MFSGALLAERYYRAASPDIHPQAVMTMKSNEIWQPHLSVLQQVANGISNSRRAFFGRCHPIGALYF